MLLMGRDWSYYAKLNKLEQNIREFHLYKVWGDVR